MSRRYLEDLFEDNIVYSYGEAVYDIIDFLKDNLSSHNTVLLPSRGSYPFYKAAKIGSSLANLYEFDTKVENHNVIVLPFTADYTQDFEEFSNISKEIRNYWVEVYRGFVENDSNNYATRLYKSSLNHVLGISEKKQRGKLFREKPYNFYVPQENTIDKTIFIDTVVSGRASSEILTSMIDKKLNVKPLLIADNSGKSINPQYNVEGLVNKMGGKMIYVPKLFTEDTSPGINGATSLVFPELMAEMSNIPQLQDMGIRLPGIGTWMEQPIHKFPHTSLDEASAQLSKYPLVGSFGLIENLIEYSYYYLLGFEKNAVEKSINVFKEKIISQIEQNELLNPQTTLYEYEIGLGFLPQRVLDSSVSSSHVIRANFSRQNTKDLVSELKRSLNK